MQDTKPRALAEMAICNSLLVLSAPDNLGQPYNLCLNVVHDFNYNLGRPVPIAEGSALWLTNGRRPI